MSKRNISIVWDFDGTLTEFDSTSKVIEHFKGRGGDKAFWQLIKSLGQSGYSSKKDWEHVLASDAPTWMYSLAKIASANGVPLNGEFFSKLVSEVPLYKEAESFLRKIKNLENKAEYSSLGIKIHHFIVSAGLKEFVELLVPADTFSWIWGCRYAVAIDKDDKSGEKPENIPVFCMDETMKTRALFEICKGVFLDDKRQVNQRFENEKLWCQFENLIYIGDGPTDIPALSLVRDRGGFGIVVYNHEKAETEIKKRLGQMSAEKRCDVITPAEFSERGELFSTISSKCELIRKKFAAEEFKIK